MFKNWIEAPTYWQTSSEPSLWFQCLLTDDLQHWHRVLSFIIVLAVLKNNNLKLFFIYQGTQLKQF